MTRNERAELLEHLNRCRDLLDMMKAPAARRTIIELITYLESKLADMDAE